MKFSHYSTSGCPGTTWVCFPRVLLLVAREQSPTPTRPVLPGHGAERARSPVLLRALSRWQRRGAGRELGSDLLPPALRVLSATDTSNYSYQPLSRHFPGLFSEKGEERRPRPAAVGGSAAGPGPSVRSRCPFTSARVPRGHELLSAPEQLLWCPGP